MATLNPAAQTSISQASPAAIAQAFGGLSMNFAVNHWLSPLNLYRVDCIANIKAALATGGPGINSGDLSQYIAASAPLHCTDGWTFLARSLDCYVNGSPHQAAHFAYYAELRAAMSILAARGIGIFDKQHFIVDANLDCIQIPQRLDTHQFAWLALDTWAQAPMTGEAVLDLFVVSGQTIKDWFLNRPGSPVATSIAKEWLKEWGLDLSILGQDHLLRNISSYRPNEFSPLDTDARASSTFLRDLWSLFEPSATRFEKLDSELLRVLIKKTFAATGFTPTGRSGRFRSHIDDIVAAVGISDIEREQFRRFFQSEAASPQLLSSAETLGPTNDPTAHQRMIARAALLLRVASGFSARLIAGAPFALTDLTFWTSPLAERRAFWSPGAELSDFADLWQDVSLAVDDDREWIRQRAPGPIAMHEWRQERAEVVRPLSECDRVGLWGLQR
jgi:hypothetical protein